MSLITCPECGWKVSDRARACPNCGLPQEYFQEVTEEKNNPFLFCEIEELKDAITSFLPEYKELMFGDEYISCRRIAQIAARYQQVYQVVSRVKGIDKLATMLQMQQKQVQYFMEHMETLEDDLERHNDRCIDQSLRESEEYLDQILYKVDPKIQLDEEQRKVVLTDDDYALVVAGAGAGKTTTMAAKVKYLVEKKGVNPEEIIVISFTNKAVKELSQRIHKKLKIPAKVMTFHAFGNAIIRENSETMPGLEWYKRGYFIEILKEKIFQNPVLMRKVILFFGYYMDVPLEALKFHTVEQYHEYRLSMDYETLRSTLGDYQKVTRDIRKGEQRTIRGEFLRSVQEVQIANYLYLHGIDYEYERVYEHKIPGAKKMYTPDFYLKQDGKVAYLEHFGVSEDGMSDCFTKEELERYKQHAVEKAKLHKRYGTILLFTYSQYMDKRSLLEHLEEVLVKAGFVLRPRSEREVYQQLMNREKDKYIIRFAIFMETFIGKYKTNGWDQEHFAVLKEKTDNVRNQLFLDIAEDVYIQYQAMLRAKNRIDFEDMINLAEKKLEEKQRRQERLPYQYIIVDEYQDIARQRFNLTKKLSDICKAKVVAVGDDWQSIYAFSGSDIHLFMDFTELMGGGKQLKITRTYRNSQELIDIAGDFIQRNDAQIKKSLKSPKHLKDPVRIQAYDDTSTIMKNKSRALLKTIEEIVAEFGERAEILLISRYNFEINQFCKAGALQKNSKTGKISCEKYPHLKLSYMTAHSSKGLGFDNVIVLNGAAGKFGFPSQIEDDPIMKLVTVNDDSMPFAEERRLFYVAMTRTKNRVHILTPYSAPSQFVIELIQKYKLPFDQKINLRYDGKKISRLKCPVCGWPLKKEYNTNYGLTLNICTNEPEICDFMTNSQECLKDIYLCGQCDNGYMVVKKSKQNHYFFGCTNYFVQGIDCKHTEQIFWSKNDGIEITKEMVRQGEHRTRNNI